MVKVYEGNLMAKGLKFGIVVSRFNEFITSKLLDGALDALKRHEVEDCDVDILWVPGAFEIPLAAQKLAKTGNYDAVVCLGTVIRGSTPHFEYVAAEVSKGVAHLNMSTGLPIAFGVLTTDNIEQAVERAGSKSGNKGAEAALSAIEMVNLFKELDT